MQSPNGMTATRGLNLCGDAIAERINGDYGCSEESIGEAIAARQVGIAERDDGDYGTNDRYPY